jgi:hypothetical protein
VLRKLIHEREETHFALANHSAPDAQNVKLWRTEDYFQGLVNLENLAKRNKKLKDGRGN